MKTNVNEGRARRLDEVLALLRARLSERLFDWLATRKRRTTVDDEAVERRTDNHREHGIHIGIW